MSMKYKGYTASVRYVPEDDVFCGRVDGISDRIVFIGSSVEELKKEFKESINFYLESCAQTGDKPQRPSSGNVMLRMAPAIHSAALSAARTAGHSLNKWVEALVARETGVEPQGKTARHSRSSHAPRATRRREAA